MWLLYIFSGEADSTTISSQQGALDQGTASTNGMATAADDEVLRTFMQYLKLKSGNKLIYHKNYNFLNCDWFKKLSIRIPLKPRKHFIRMSAIHIIFMFHSFHGYDEFHKLACSQCMGLHSSVSGALQR